MFIQRNAFENVVWKTVAILSWPQCVKYLIVRNTNTFGGSSWTYIQDKTTVSNVPLWYRANAIIFYLLRWFQTLFDKDGIDDSITPVLAS